MDRERDRRRGRTASGQIPAIEEEPMMAVMVRVNRINFKRRRESGKRWACSTGSHCHGDYRTSVGYKKHRGCKSGF